MERERKRGFFTELEYQLRREGYDVQEINGDNLLPVEWDGQSLCRISEEGTVRCFPSEVSTRQAVDACARAAKVSRIVADYMAKMECAPPLTASELRGDYRLLAEFNGTVLAGHFTPYETQFITWSRTADGMGLTLGNYFYDNYEGAKQDFAVRSGLIPRAEIFSKEQLSDIYKAVDFYLEMDESLTDGQLERLEQTLNQIEELVPELQGSPDACQQDWGEQSLSM
nr:hypothetical protein [uncultured Oscillibacter sp.]